MVGQNTVGQGFRIVYGMSGQDRPGARCWSGYGTVSYGTVGQGMIGQVTVGRSTLAHETVCQGTVCQGAVELCTVCQDKIGKVLDVGQGTVEYGIYGTVALGTIPSMERRTRDPWSFEGCPRFVEWWRPEWRSGSGRAGQGYGISFSIDLHLRSASSIRPSGSSARVMNEGRRRGRVEKRRMKNGEGDLQECKNRLIELN